MRQAFHAAHHKRSLMIAGMFTILAWLAGFLISTLTAIYLLLFPATGGSEAESPLRDTAGQMVLDALTIGLALAACFFMLNARIPWPRMHGRKVRDLSAAALMPRLRRLGALNSPRSLEMGLWVYLIYLGAMISGGWIGKFFAGILTPATQVEYPDPNSPSTKYVWSQLPLRLLAGPTEELLYAATIPLLAFLAVKNKKWALLIGLTASTVLRVAFHLYYGLPYSIGIAFWAALAVLLWWKSGQLLALVLAHSANNLLSWFGSFSEHFPGWAYSLACVLVMALPLVLALWAASKRTGWLVPAAMRT